MIECRAMTWTENERFEDYIDDKVKENIGNITDGKYLRLASPWIMEHIYNVTNIDECGFTPAEVIAVAARTITLTGAIRDDEIKNLKSLPDGSTSEPTTAETAEK